MGNAEPLGKLMQNPGPKLELLIVTATVFVCGVSVAFSSVLARHALTEMYSVDLSYFRIETRMALTAWWWAPVVFGLLVIALWVVKLSRPNWHWISWSILGVTCLISTLVLYGIVSPFATTTFRMNNEHAAFAPSGENAARASFFQPRVPSTSRARQTKCCSPSHLERNHPSDLCETAG